MLQGTPQVARRASVKDFARGVALMVIPTAPTHNPIISKVSQFRCLLITPGLHPPTWNSENYKHFAISEFSEFAVGMPLVQ
jgi:hypothetical protein